MKKFCELSSAGKFNFAKEFLLRYRVAHSLKPALPEPTLISYIANKFYGGDIVNLQDCIAFIGTQCGEVPIENAGPVLDQKQLELKNEISSKKTEAQKKMKSAQDDYDSKHNDYKKTVAERNKQVENNIKLEKSLRSKTLIKIIMVALVVLAGVSVIAGFGGIAGTVNTVMTYIMGLSVASTLTLVGLGFVTKKIVDKFKKDKKDGKKQSKQQQLEEELKKGKDKLKELDAQLDQKRTEEVTALTNLNNEQANYSSTMSKLSGEEVEEGLYRRNTDFDKLVESYITNIDIKYSEVKSNMEGNGMSTAEINNLENWHMHYVGSIYYGVSRGSIIDESQLQTIKDEAEKQFERIADPADMSDKRYNKTNVSAGTSVNTNTFADDMFAMI